LASFKGLHTQQLVKVIAQAEKKGKKLAQSIGHAPFTLFRPTSCLRPIYGKRDVHFA
jgi:hypothetical protein